MRQKAALERCYADSSKPSAATIVDLSRSLQLDPAVVRCWFSNRRQKERSLSTAEELINACKLNGVHALNLVTVKQEVI